MVELVREKSYEVKSLKSKYVRDLKQQLKEGVYSIKGVGWTLFVLSDGFSYSISVRPVKGEDGIERVFPIRGSGLYTIEDGFLYSVPDGERNKLLPMTFVGRTGDTLEVNGVDIDPKIAVYRGKIEITDKGRRIKRPSEVRRWLSDHGIFIHPYMKGLSEYRRVQHEKGDPYGGLIPVIY